MLPFNYQELPPFCMDKATDILGNPGASQIELAIARTEVQAAVVCELGSIAYAACRVSDCPVRCKIFHSTDEQGMFRATGVSSEAGVTDLSNCKNN